MPIEPSSLYPDEDEIGRVVLGTKRKREWKGLATTLERHGLPPIDPQFGGRYWPAVRAFLDRRARLDKPERPATRNHSDDR
jgi:hypothetical protein